MVRPSRTGRESELDRPLETVRYAKGKHADLLAKLGIKTVQDLLTHLPIRYLDVSHVADIGAQFEGDITCSGVVTSVKVKRPRPSLRITEVALSDKSGTVFGIWFNQPWVATTIHEGHRYAFAGTMVYERGMRRMQNPFTYALDRDTDQPEGRIIPIYPSTEGLAQGWIRRIIDEALDDLGECAELIPDDIRSRHSMRTYRQALLDVHRPSSVHDALGARNRLVYQELFELGLLHAVHKHCATREDSGIAHPIDAELIEQAQALFAVTFTGEQRAALNDILGDMEKPFPMRRLLLGDVGTGKTFVATVALMAVADAGHQSAVMAPTEILAKQYAIKIGPLLEKRAVSWVLLTSSLSDGQRRETIRRIGSGEVDVVFGTHALIQDDVAFRNLSLVVIDEQHRFGVAQRAHLRDKSPKAPDMLAMTATPIPRSLALALYGDLDISTIRSRPIPGAGTSTFVRTFARVSDAHTAAKQALALGQQAFIVCALIEESSTLEIHAATKLAESLARDEYRQWRVGLLHGDMKPEEKDRVMAQFRSADIDVLVSTTVIEVGLDIHNATVMIVYNAERFGLAQLHQLRGRVGRGGIPGQFWLISDARTAGSCERLEALRSTDDGFALAEIDLALRGAGDIVGTRQHGAATFRLADPVRDVAILEMAMRDAQDLVMQDPHLEKTEHQPLKSRLELLQEGYDDWVRAG